MTTLDRYLLREITVPFGVGLALFFVVVTFGELLKISDAVTGLGIGPEDFLLAVVYSLPPLLGLLLPIAGLFATLLGVGRLAADREVLALSAGGVSPYRLLRVPMVVGIFLGLLTAAGTLVGEPWGISGIKKIMARGAQSALAKGVRVGEFNQWIEGVSFLARSEDEQGLVGIFLSDRRHEDQPVVVSARRGRVRPGATARDIVLDLHDGVILSYGSEGDTHRVVRFEAAKYRLDVGQIVDGKLWNVTRAQGMYPSELWAAGHDPDRPPRIRAKFLITLHRKLALPLATVIFALLAVPMACRSTSGARAQGFLFCVGVVGAYYYVGRAVEMSARGGAFPVHLAAWVPNLLGVVALGFFLWRFGRTAR